MDYQMNYCLKASGNSSSGGQEQLGADSFDYPLDSYEIVVYNIEIEEASAVEN